MHITSTSFLHRKATYGKSSAKTAYNVEDVFLKTSSMIYENIDRGVYDLSSDKSGIRVGNESFAI